MDLSAQLGGLAGVVGFDVELTIAHEVYEQLQSGLLRIFRDIPDVLVLA